MSTDPRPASPINPLDARLQAVARLVGIVDRLRAPDGCPWDRKQTLESMAPHLVEEAHEALEAIERASDADSAEELGDILMVVALICRIAEQSSRFDLARAADAVSDKLVRRHPHVFGTVEASSAEQVLANWEAIKRAERSEKAVDASAIAGVPIALPALQRASRICSKAVSAGFRWSSVREAREKLVEEQRELDEALDASPQESARIEHELGDVLLAAAFLATYFCWIPLCVMPGAAERRFRAMNRSSTGR
jgi:MazG family protein